MSFSAPVVGCSLKKGFQKGDHGHPRTPLAMPLQIDGWTEGLTDR